MEKGGKKKREKHKGHAFFKFTYYIHLFFVFMEIPQKINEKKKKNIQQEQKLSRSSQNYQIFPFLNIQIHTVVYGKNKLSYLKLLNLVVFMFVYLSLKWG